MINVAHWILVAFLSQDSQSIQKLIRDLQSESPEVRDAATQQLLDHEAEAIAPLQEAAKKAEPEVQMRIRKILRDLSPEGTFARIRSKCVNSKSIRIAYATDIEYPTGRFVTELNIKGGLVVKENRKARLAYEEHLNPSVFVKIVDNAEGLVSLIVDLGSVPSVDFYFDLHRRGQIITRERNKCLESLKIFNVEFGVKTDSEGCITYKAEYVSRTVEAEILKQSSHKLWYKRKTLLPTRRESRTDTASIKEVYADWKLNDPIPDAVFTDTERK